MGEELVLKPVDDRGPALRPLLKWPGGKRALLDHIIPLLPQSFNRYFEPFAGGAALFFALQPQQAVLADRNSDLIACYTQVRDRPEEVIECMGGMPNTKDDYYRIRDEMVPASEAERAARFIYLASLSFNGIYRVNLDGKFNVPYGFKAHLQPCDQAAIRAASTALASARLLPQTFGKALSSAAEGDLVYLDPPYTVVHSQNGFLKYNARIFSWEDQKQLAKTANRLAGKGCHVIVSNADHEAIRTLYKDFAVRVIKRPSVIAASSHHRRTVTECLFYKEQSA